MKRHHSHNISQRDRRAKKAALLKRDGDRCQLCGEAFTEDRPASFAHRIARGHGGGSDLPNLFLAHNDCNNKRTAPKLGRRRVAEDAPLNGAPSKPEPPKPAAAGETEDP